MDNTACDVQAEEAETSFQSSKKSQQCIDLEADEHSLHSENGSVVDQKGSQKQDLIYSVYDRPPWTLSMVLGFQHILTAFGGIISIPFILLPAMCSTDPLVTAEVINTNFFVSGMVTALQCTLGIRLPILQGGTFAFVTPTLAILSLPEWQCSDSNATTEDWEARMCEIQGAIIGASLFEVLIGLTGAVGLMLRFIGPLVIAPTIALIGISLFASAYGYCESNWLVAIVTMVLIILFSQYMRNVQLPCLTYRGGCTATKFPAFKLFPVLLAILLAWFLCFILTITNAIPNDESHWAYEARTDVNGDVLRTAKWFRFPYPGQWGKPTFSVGAVLGMLAGVIAGIVESIGDYYACARLSGAPPPPVHAFNRGIFTEGIGCVLAGCWGTGTGTTSYSENVGAIGITQVGSPRVVLYAGLMLMVMGVLGKVGALFVTIPTPIIGGIFMVMFGMISAVGIANLQFVNMNSSRNLFIFGFSLFFGLTVSQWAAANPQEISTGVETLDQILLVLLSTGMFVGGAVAFILDNTIPGTAEERGMLAWHHRDNEGTSASSTAADLRCYDLPLGMSRLNTWGCAQRVPVCPQFIGCCKSSPQTDQDVVEITNDNTSGI